MDEWVALSFSVLPRCYVGLEVGAEGGVGDLVLTQLWLLCLPWRGPYSICFLSPLFVLEAGIVVHELTVQLLSPIRAWCPLPLIVRPTQPSLVWKSVWNSQSVGLVHQSLVPPTQQLPCQPPKDSFLMLHTRKPRGLPGYLPCQGGTKDS